MTESRKDIEGERLQGQLNQTPAERCAEVSRDVETLMDWVKSELSHRAGQAAKDPENWDHVSRLVQVRQTLKDIVQPLLVWRYGWSGVEASRFIEDHLKEMRSR